MARDGHQYLRGWFKQATTMAGQTHVQSLVAINVPYSKCMTFRWTQREKA